MTSKLAKEDIKLLKRRFKKLHTLIKEHQSTPPVVLNLLSKQPKEVLSFVNPFYAALLTIAVSFLVTVTLDYQRTGNFYGISPPWSNAVIIRFIFLAFIVIFMSIRLILNSFDQLRETRLLYEFMKISHEENDESNQLREYLKHRTPPKKERRIKIFSLKTSRHEWEV